MYKIKTIDTNGSILDTEYFMSQPDTTVLQKAAVSKWGKGVRVVGESVRYTAKNSLKSPQVLRK